ncbi:hypothetical protein [uncultured Tenacibaculum sp.]|uniref:hypothetical protein n=1 Tax=uncultured Tenacibaculum sp. TaxID=174713 RepID=UPI00262B174E|nr:hypothetical protein [uncultured Tenacibaculum sp.]
MENNKKEIIYWSEFIKILDSLQVASGYSYGLRQIKLIKEKIEKNDFIIIKDKKKYFVENMVDLQILIDEYDSSIQLDQLV